MALVPFTDDPYNELARLILAIDGRAIHAITRHPLMGGGLRLRFTIPSVQASADIVRLCKRQGWRFTQPSGIQMVVDVPVTLARLQPTATQAQQELTEGQRGLPSNQS